MVSLLRRVVFVLAIFHRIEGSSVCSGVRRSRDAIVWLGQRKHSSYDASHKNTLNASMTSVAAMYEKVDEADVLVWHEGELTNEDANALESRTNVRFCVLSKDSGWGRPASQLQVVPSRKGRWSEGYLSMIRWYAISSWDILTELGYAWVMRFDDDSFILSKIQYNLFDALRTSGAIYGYRSIARECDRNFGFFIDEYIAENQIISSQLLDDGTILCEKFPKRCNRDGRPLHPLALKKPSNRYCDGPGRLGFYNNFFVTKISFWISEKVRHFRRAFDDSALIFSHRANDLIFQTAAVRLFLPRSKWLHFADFTYLHHTVRDDQVTWGGLETGYDDPNAEQTVNSYLQKWHPSENLASSSRVYTCRIQPHVNTTRFRRVFYIPHGKTRWAFLAAPYCNKNGFLPLW